MHRYQEIILESSEWQGLELSLNQFRCPSAVLFMYVLILWQHPPVPSKNFRGSESAQCVQTLPTNPDNLRVTPGTLTVEGENSFPRGVL